ncbi:MAG: hypothetical protein ACYDCO_21110 [Armatimonadota bacterium]
MAKVRMAAIAIIIGILLAGITGCGPKKAPDPRKVEAPPASMEAPADAAATPTTEPAPEVAPEPAPEPEPVDPNPEPGAGLE